MKNCVFFIIAAIAICGCGTSQQTYDRYVDTHLLDYRPYAEAGFFISPNSYPGVYSPVGDILIRVFPAVYLKDNNKVLSAKTGGYDDGIYSRSNDAAPNSRTKTEEISSSELLDIAVGEALKLGANGISNFRCSSIYDTHVDRSGSHRVFSHYEISGLCISIEK